MVPDLLIIFLAAMPVIELTVTLPIALQTYGMDPARALLDCYIGNALPVIPLLFGLKAFVDWCERKSPRFHKFMLNYFGRVRVRFQKHYDRYGALALFLYVAIPTPFSGVWSGAVAAVLFGIRPKYAAPALIAGMMVAGLIVLGVTKGIVKGIHLF
mgnify:CR=1 FL=1